MKQIITMIALLISISTHSQKILFHTTTLCKYADSSIEFTEFTNGTSSYTVWFSSSNIANIGTKVVKTNTERIGLEFATKDKMINCLQYLYNFDKGEGYFIDLENLSGNKVMSGKKYFIFYSKNDIDKPIVSQWLIGKMLNTIGVSVVKNGDKTNKSDDMYKHESPLF